MTPEKKTQSTSLKARYSRPPTMVLPLPTLRRLKRAEPPQAPVSSHLHQRFARNWIRSVFPALKPRSSFPPDKIEQLFHHAGYLSLTDNSTRSGWHDFDSKSSFDWGYTSADGSPIAHVSITRAYETTWVYHQFTGLSGHAETFDSRYAIYRAMAQVPPWMDGPRAHAIAYFNPQLPWHQHYFYAFERDLSDANDVEIDNVDRFRLRLRASGPAVQNPGNVSVATPEEVAVCVSIARMHWTPLVCRALDVSPSSLRSLDLTQGRGSDLERTRELFVVRRGHEVVATALAERGHQDLSIFGLFDMVHVLPRRDGLQPSRAELLQLIETVRTWYGRTGNEETILTAPPNTIDATWYPSLRFVETTGRFTLSGRGLIKYEDFVRRAFAEYRRAVHAKREEH